MKKWIALLCAGILASAVLYGCGSKEGGDGGTTGTSETSTTGAKDATTPTTPATDAGATAGGTTTTGG